MGDSTVQVAANYHTHTLTYYPEVAATCTEDGSKAYYQCSDEECNALFWDAEGTQPVADAGELVIPATGHSLTYVEAKDPTSTEAGNKAYYVCETCGTWFWDEAATNVIDNHDDVILAATGQDGSGTDAGNSSSGDASTTAGTSDSSTSTDAHTTVKTGDSATAAVGIAAILAAVAAATAAAALILRHRSRGAHARHNFRA